MHQREFIDTMRYTLSVPQQIVMDDTVHMMNLVEGRQAQIASVDGSFPAFTIHYAETVIVPAGVKSYQIIPDGEEIKMIVASVR